MDNVLDVKEINTISVADPGFPIGGVPTHWGGTNLRHVHFLAKMYAKAKEMDPVGGGGHMLVAPPGSANVICNLFYDLHFHLHRF